MEPLANKIRPASLDEFVGQEHLVGEGKPLKQAIQNRHLFSFILWGPPGVGKTTLARIYAKAMEADYHELSAVSAGKEDIRKIISNNKFQITPSQPLAPCRGRKKTRVHPSRFPSLEGRGQGSVTQNQKFFSWTKSTALTKPNRIFYCLL